MEDIIDVSKRIWAAMQEENIEVLQELLHPKAMFVHMGVTLMRDEELKVIQTKKIVYKEVAIEQQSMTSIADTSIVLTKLKMTAIVDGTQVCNPFVVSEVYVKQDNQSVLVCMSYTKIIY